MRKPKQINNRKNRNNRNNRNKPPHHSTSALQHFSTTALQHYSTSAPQHFSTTAPPHHYASGKKNFTTMTIKNSRDSEIRYYNIRVYAIIMKGRYKVLLSDEYMMDMKMTKFPGGGMNFGEGPADAMFREAMEEFGQEIRIIRHYYTTDFFQRSMFFPDHQLISIYWLARFDRPVKFRISDKPFDFAELKNGNQSFRWCDIRQIQTEDLTFPIDRIVLNMLKNDVQSRKVSD